MSMNSSQVRIIDPILSNVVRGYRNATYVADALFPRVPVLASGGQIITFGKDAFRTFNTARSPGSKTKRVMFGYAGEKFSLSNNSLEGVVPREFLRDAKAVPGIDLGRNTVNLTMNALLLGMEVQAAKMATTSGNYNAGSVETPSGTDLWDNPDSAPSTQIADARETVRSQIGLYPNTAVLGAKAFAALKNHPQILDRLKYTSRDSLTTDMLAKLWDMDKVVVGAAVAMDESDNMSDVWGTSVILGYTAIGNLGVQEPSFGYNYTMEGNPMVEQPYWDESVKSWVYPVTYECDPVIAGKDAGFLFTTVVGGE